MLRHIYDCTSNLCLYVLFLSAYLHHYLYLLV
uniref:Uncharacterized protein n=1 Tax=Anguilla anguilla TaxID=7936 RepID=A0A0E9Q8Y9_ANGAN